ncbi:hypothetical protein BIZ78_gp172 [Erwinia phage vB_EamM_Caitlin]|uniref:hypothetical protein n=1 Tax=Erwinia phage vB_EamM_Caitlin TaxID=1883379 RepID=UPI00081C9723|nr:hypothetical protein BIZ78_gp172 [Erwinia phage vB_EamM_Caitlin]ANZ48403.1 hypothetical protein CAITLIN_108 [Erwinia phage vB_EamM_Caitlin]
MTEKYQITSADGKKRLTVNELPSKSLWATYRTMEFHVLDVESGETKVLTNRVKRLAKVSDVENAARVQKGLMKELGVQFFKLVVRKPDALEAYRQSNWKEVARLAPLYGYLSEFVGLFSTTYLGTEWVVPPADFTRIATLQSRGTVKGIELVVTQKLSYNPVNSDMVLIETKFFPSRGRSDFIRMTGWLEVSHFYRPEAWPTVKNYLAEERIQALLTGWLHDIESPMVSAAMTKTPE